MGGGGVEIAEFTFRLHGGGFDDIVIVEKLGFYVGRWQSLVQASSATVICQFLLFVFIERLYTRNYQQSASPAHL